MSALRCYYNGPLEEFAALLAERLNTTVDFRDYENEWEWVWIHFREGFLDTSRNHDDMRGGYKNPISIHVTKADKQKFLDWDDSDAETVAQQIDGQVDLVGFVNEKETILKTLKSEQSGGECLLRVNGKCEEK